MAREGKLYLSSMPEKGRGADGRGRKTLRKSQLVSCKQPPKTSGRLQRRFVPAFNTELGGGRGKEGPSG